jgi:hypothetical protein
VYRTVFLLFLVFGFGSFFVRAFPADDQTGTLLDVVEYDWCHHDCGPFNTDSALVCVQVDGSTFVGDRKLGDDWKEYYPQLSEGQRKPITVRLDRESIWIKTVGGKEFRFTQKYDEDVMHTPECTAEIHRHMLKRLGHAARPASVPSDAVLIPEGGRFFLHFYSWVSCSFDAPENDDICTYWDKTGRKDYKSHVVSGRDRRPVPQEQLQIDPLTTRRNEVRLTKGIALVSDGRARINGKLVEQQAKP